LPSLCPAAELILPQNRTAFYAAEAIEFAVAGLKKDDKATLGIVPRKKGLATIRHTFTGDGSTHGAVLPGNTLAPAEYNLTLDGKPAGKLTISSGIPISPLKLSATVNAPKTAGANFLVSNAFSFGLLDHRGQALE